jgi:hypothetical protein
MNRRFGSTLLLGMFLIFASAARGNNVRSGSGYGTTTEIGSSSTIAMQWAVCVPMSTNCDLLVQIDGPADMNQPIQITLNNTLFGGAGFLKGEDGNPSPTFGLIDCVNSTSTNLGSMAGTPCFAFGSPMPPTQDLGCNLSSVTDVGGIFTIPSGACLDATNTFYFDVTATSVDGINPATVGQATSAPEPSSLALVAMALIPVGFLSRRRQQA